MRKHKCAAQWESCEIDKTVQKFEAAAPVGTCRARSPAQQPAQPVVMGAATGAPHPPNAAQRVLAPPMDQRRPSQVDLAHTRFSAEGPENCKTFLGQRYLAIHCKAPARAQGHRQCIRRPRATIQLPMNERAAERRVLRRDRARERPAST